MRDNPWEDIFKLSASDAAIESCELVQVRIFIYIYIYINSNLNQLAYANKAKESITFNKLGSWNFWQTANSVFNKDKSAILSLFNGLVLLSSASDKAKFLAENFCKNSNLVDPGISLPVYLELILNCVKFLQLLRWFKR